MRHQWLIARRVAQLAFLGIFLSGPLAGVWIAKGTLASSLTLGVLPLTDPLILTQSLVAGHRAAADALIGAAIVLAFYLAVGGRAYCAWACPVNLITDLAAWLRLRLGLRGDGLALPRTLRLWLMGGVLAASAATGAIAWELVNPVTLLQRGIVTGSILAGGAGLPAAVAVFLFDFGLAARGWCTHLCPVGAFYGLLGRFSLVRVSARGRAACDNCMDCFAVCPERQVIAPALRGAAKGVGPLILSGDCTNCGRCIDVCPKDVFRFSTRFSDRRDRQVLEGE